MNGLLLVIALASASPEPALTVVGAGAAPMALSLDDLKALGKQKATWKEHGTEHTVEGVPLSAVLKLAGVTPGDMKGLPPRDKRAGYKKVVVAGAPDGFQAVFSVAELDADMGQTRALLVWSVDGAPLSADKGPLRLAVLTDGEPSRSVYTLRTLHVVDMRTVVPPAR